MVENLQILNLRFHCNKFERTEQKKLIKSAAHSRYNHMMICVYLIQHFTNIKVAQGRLKYRKKALNVQRRAIIESHRN